MGQVTVYILLVTSWLMGWWFYRRLKHSKTIKMANIASYDVSVIIPARNESENLSNHLPSILAAGFREVIVVDDHSTDQTSHLAYQLGAQVIVGTELPHGYTGKTWACLQGAQMAKGDHLLFLDADCFLVNSKKLLMIPDIDQSWVFSYLPFHQMKETYEGLSLFFLTIMSLGVLGGQHRLFGQSMIIRKETYLKSLSHEEVKGAILENFMLAQQCLSKGIMTQSALGKGILSMRMFPNGVKDMNQSWLKAFATGATQTNPVLLGFIILWITGLSSTIGLLFTQSSLGLIIYLLFAWQCFCIARLLGNYGWKSILFFPIPLLYFHVIFGLSVLRKIVGTKTQWKGRNVSQNS